MKTIAKGDKGNREVRFVTDDIVAVSFTWKPNDAEDAPRYQAEDVTVNFADVRKRELRELAIKTVVIILARMWRSAWSSNGRDALQKMDKRNYSVRELLDQAKTRTSASPDVKAKRALGEMDKAEIAELLASYNPDGTLKK